MTYQFKNHDEDDIDWARIFWAMTHPKIDEKSGEEYIDATPAEMEAIDKYCAFLLMWKFNERHDLPEPMRQKQDLEFKALCDRSFAYLTPKLRR